MKKLYSLPHYSPLPGIFKGLLWALVGTFISTWIIVIVIFVLLPLFTSTHSSIPSISITELLIGIVGTIFTSLGLTYMGFFVLGLPVMLLPSTSASIALSVWLHRDAEQNRLSKRSAQVKGAILGGLAGFIGLFMPLNFIGWPELWISMINSEKNYILFWAVLIVIPSVAAITGSLFGKNLAEELEPKEDFFDIDWDALKDDAP